MSLLPIVPMEKIPKRQITVLKEIKKRTDISIKNIRDNMRMR